MVVINETYGLTYTSEHMCFRHELYTTGVTVHIIEPGFFRTGIVDDDSIAKGMEARFNALDPEVMEYYGKEYLDTCTYIDTDFNIVLKYCYLEHSAIVLTCIKQ